MRRVVSAHGDAPLLKIGYLANRAVGADYHDGGQVPIAVTHADCFGAAAEGGSDALGLDPGQRRIPRHVYVAREVSFHLALVIGVQDVIEIESVALEIGLEAIPDGDHLRIVGDGAEQQGSGVGHGVSVLLRTAACRKRLCR